MTANNHVVGVTDKPLGSLDLYYPNGAWDIVPRIDGNNEAEWKKDANARLAAYDLQLGKIIEDDTTHRAYELTPIQQES